MEWQDNFLNVTWEDFRQNAFDLSRHVKENGQHFDLIVAIARGGLALSQLLSDNLGLPIASFTVQSYKDLKQASIPHIVYGLDAKLSGKKILLVDDVSDTGKTFIRGIEYLEELGAHQADITTCAMHYKPHSTYTPDFFVGKTSKWIIYPYEVQETMTTLYTQWQKMGISISEIQKRFSQFAFLSSQINTFFKN